MTSTNNVSSGSNPQITKCSQSEQCSGSSILCENQNGETACTNTNDVFALLDERLEKPWENARQLANGFWRFEAQTLEGKEHVDIRFKNPFEASEFIFYTNNTQTLAVNLGDQEGHHALPIYHLFARESAFVKSQEDLLKSIPNGATAISNDESIRIFGSRNNGTSRKVMVVVPHEDDEIGISGTLSRIIKENGAENVVILYISSGDGNKWNASREDQNEFGEYKMHQAVKSCYGELGIPEENIRFMPASEVTWYNGFITPQVRQMQANGEPLPEGFPEDFKYVDDLVMPTYKITEWIYRNMMEFKPDIILTGDTQFSLQLHDMASELTRIALTSYVKDTNRNPKLFVFPQQSKQGTDVESYYRYPADREETMPVIRVPLTKAETQVKKDVTSVYANFWGFLTGYKEDTMLFLGYYFNMSKDERRHLFENEYFRNITPVEVGGTLVFEPQPCPKDPKDLGYKFEDNDNHYGFPHTCEDAIDNVLFGHDGKKGLLDMIEENPLTTGSTDGYDPFKNMP